MRRDRFLITILVGIGLLAVLSLVIYFARRTDLTYGSENTPEGVVRNYAVALQKRDYDRAYTYLAEVKGKPDFAHFRQPFTAFQNHDIALTGIEITSTVISDDGQSAVVYLFVQRGGSGPFDDGYRESNSAELLLQDNTWKIRSMPFPFWSYDWPMTTPANFKDNPATAP